MQPGTPDPSRIAKWDRRLEIVKLLTPDQFAEALKTNLTGGWLWKFLASNPGALKRY